MKVNVVVVVVEIAVVVAVVVVIVVARHVCVLQCGVCLCEEEGVVGAQIVETGWLVPAAVLLKGRRVCGCVRVLCLGRG